MPKTNKPKTKKVIQRFAETYWCAEDVQKLRPQMSTRAAEDFLVANEKHIQSAMIEKGWEVIEFALSMLPRK